MIPSGMLCASGDGTRSEGQDSCRGDSGGPLFFEPVGVSTAPDYDRRPIQIGIVSWALGMRQHPVRRRAASPPRKSAAVGGAVFGFYWYKGSATAHLHKKQVRLEGKLRRRPSTTNLPNENAAAIECRRRRQCRLPFPPGDLPAPPPPSPFLTGCASETESILPLRARTTQTLPARRTDRPCPDPSNTPTAPRSPPPCRHLLHAPPPAALLFESTGKLESTGKRPTLEPVVSVVGVRLSSSASAYERVAVCSNRHLARRRIRRHESIRRRRGPTCCCGCLGGIPWRIPQSDAGGGAASFYRLLQRRPRRQAVRARR